MRVNTTPIDALIQYKQANYIENGQQLNTPFHSPKQGYNRSISRFRHTSLSPDPSFFTNGNIGHIHNWGEIKSPSPSPASTPMIITPIQSPQIQQIISDKNSPAIVNNSGSNSLLQSIFQLSPYQKQNQLFSAQQVEQQPSIYSRSSIFALTQHPQASIAVPPPPTTANMSLEELLHMEEQNDINQQYAHSKHLHKMHMKHVQRHNRKRHQRKENIKEGQKDINEKKEKMNNVEKRRKKKYHKKENIRKPKRIINEQINEIDDVPLTKARRASKPEKKKRNEEKGHKRKLEKQRWKQVFSHPQSDIPPEFDNKKS
ncbi:MAG: hypothetical protein EZS28_009002 [Streblomastix strix]|uniref:Uncharacterized protein n=1 Tax=Streblomastix strix TaxID=222440 RepID=A0A5J4WMJ2_9EUKA|nr:MAG: hypothetical protein EZS28_009002 [Streblomastix strix]